MGSPYFDCIQLWGETREFFFVVSVIGKSSFCSGNLNFSERNLDARTLDNLWKTEVTGLILDIVSRDEAAREHAFKRLQEHETQNLGRFLLSLVAVFVNSDKTEESRILAAQRLRRSLAPQWLCIDPATKLLITEELVKVHGSAQVVIALSASAIVTKLASIELKVNQWPTLLEQLILDISQATTHAKVAILKTLGNLCNDIPEERINTILTAVVQTTMDVAEVKKAGFECLSLFTWNFYANLRVHVPSIINATAPIATNSVVKSVIVLWISILKKELYILQTREGTAFNFAQVALPRLLPHLLDIDAATHDEELVRVTCLRLLAHVLGEDLVPDLSHCIWNLEDNLINQTWNQVICLFLDDPCDRMLWVLEAIIPLTRELVQSETWEKIITVLTDSIRNAKEEAVIAKACQVWMASTVYFRKIGTDSHLVPILVQFGQSIIDLCHTDVSLALKIKACVNLDRLLTCLTEECAVHFLLNPQLETLPGSDRFNRI